LHPQLEPILKETYGIMIYQEQVMKIAQVLGGYTLGGADKLRKVMGKKMRDEIPKQRAMFTEGALKNGIDVDILYRNLDDFAEGVASVVEGYQAHNGYTTCMWHNLRTCKIVYDKEGRLAALKERFDVPYPKRLKDNIMDRNLKLLSEVMPAYNYQIAKAVERKDLVSVCHRTAAFMESYFDIIWAMNELTHPGEKRLVSLCKKQCKILPANFEENINQLYADLFTDLDKVNEDVERIVKELRGVIYVR